MGGVYDCSILEHKPKGKVEGIKGQNIGEGRHPLRDFENMPHTSVELQENRIVISSNQSHEWRTWLWPYYAAADPIRIFAKVNSIHLRHNLGMITMEFVKRDSTAPPPKPPKCMIDVLVNQAVLDAGDWAAGINNQQSGYYTLGFDGSMYPMPNAVPYLPKGKPYKIPDVIEQVMAEKAVFEELKKDFGKCPVGPGKHSEVINPDDFP